MTDFEQKVVARHGLGLKTVEQEITEKTEILRYLCYLLFFAFGCGLPRCVLSWLFYSFHRVCFESRLCVKISLRKY